MRSASTIRALAIRLEANGSTHPRTAETRAALAAVLMAQGRITEALAAAMEAEGIGRRHLRLTLESLSERQGLAYAAARPKGLDLALSIASEPAALPPIADAVVRGRAIVLDAVATRRRFAGSSPELASLWRATTEATQRLADLAVAPSTADAARQTALIGAAQRDKEATEAALADHSAAFGARFSLAATSASTRCWPSSPRARRWSPSSATTARHQRHRPGQASSRYGPRAAYAAVVLRGRDADPVLVHTGDAATVESLVTRWRRAVVDDVSASGPPTPAADRALRSIGAALRQRVWDPVAAHLDGIDQVFVVP